MTQTTTFNAPNYLGELHMLNQAEAPFYSMIGGKAAVTTSKDFEWTEVDRTRAGSQDDVALEGADAPVDSFSRGSGSNVCQIVQEGFSVTYTKQAATGNHDGLNILGQSSVMDEKSFQAMMALQKIKEDLEWSFLNGVYAKPADNSTVRKTRGVLTAATTNLISAADAQITGITVEADDETWTKASHGLVVGDEIKLISLTGGTGLTAGNRYFVKTVPTSSTFTVSATQGGATTTVSLDASNVVIVKRNPLTKPRFDQLVRTMISNGAPMSGLVIMVNAFNKQALTRLFGYAPADRNVGGLSIDTIETDFAKLGVVYDRFVPVDTLAAINVGVCRPRVLPIAGKGYLFEEPLAKTGSADPYQIYGEIGLEYGPEEWHGQITGLTSDELVA